MSGNFGDQPGKDEPMILSFLNTRLRDYRRHRACMRELLQLTDRELDDLGMCRAELGFLRRSKASC